MLSTKAAWILPPDATEVQKAAKETQMKMLRQIANKADADYLHFLVKFQYGEEGTGLLPTSDSFSLVPSEMKKKLENMKQERLKLKRKDPTDSDRRQDYVPRARETYGQARYKFPQRGRGNFYASSYPSPYLHNSSFDNATSLPAASFSEGWAPPSYPGGFIHSVPAGNPLNFNQYGTVPNQGAYGSRYTPGGSPFKPSQWYPGSSSIQYPEQPQPTYDSRDIQERKKNSRCGKCDAYGHWHSDGLCKQADIDAKIARLRIRDEQYHQAAEEAALQLTHFSPSKGN